MANTSELRELNDETLLQRLGRGGKAKRTRAVPDRLRHVPRLRSGFAPIPTRSTSDW